MSVPPDRIYLDIPYDQKEEGKSLGAKWDKDKQRWYIASNSPNKEKAVEKWGTSITFSSKHNKSLKAFFNPSSSLYYKKK